MNLIVNHAREQVQARSVDDRIDRGMNGRIDCGNFFIFEQDRNLLNAGRQDGLSVLNECFQVVFVGLSWRGPG